MLVVAEPAATAARLSRLAGRPVVPDAAGGYALDLPRGRVRVLPAGSSRGGVRGCCGAGIAVDRRRHGGTDDANAALRRWLEDRAIPFRAGGDALLVQAGGVVVRFVPA